jgi:hypothetical protein
VGAWYSSGPCDLAPWRWNIWKPWKIEMKVMEIYGLVMFHDSAN